MARGGRKHLVTPVVESAAEGVQTWLHTRRELEVLLLFKDA